MDCLFHHRCLAVLGRSFGGGTQDEVACGQVGHRDIVQHDEITLAQTDHHDIARLDLAALNLRKAEAEGTKVDPVLALGKISRPLSEYLALMSA